MASQSRGKGGVDCQRPTLFNIRTCFPSMRLGPWTEAVQTCFASRQTQPMALPAGADAMLAHDGGDDLPDIERERIARMQENMLRMREMGLVEAKDDLNASLRASKTTQQKPPKPRTVRVVHTIEMEPRRSERTRGLPTPKYNDNELFQAMEGEAVRSRKGGKEPRAPKPRAHREPGQASRVRYNGGWHPAMGWASLAAEEKAREEALRSVQEIEDRGGVADIKAMTASQVSGGFWCQLNLAFARQFDTRAKRYINLLYDGGSWQVVLLPRPGGAGLSGGWRTFAIDQVLFPGDSVLMEKADEDNIKVQLFRAYDYDQAFKQRYMERKEKGMFDESELEQFDSGAGAAGEQGEQEGQEAEEEDGGGKSGESEGEDGEGSEEDGDQGGEEEEGGGRLKTTKRRVKESKKGQVVEKLGVQEAAEQLLAKVTRARDAVAKGKRQAKESDPGVADKTAGKGAARKSDPRAGKGTAQQQQQQQGTKCNSEGGQEDRQQHKGKRQQAVKEQAEKQQAAKQQATKQQAGRQQAKKQSRKRKGLPPVDGELEFYVYKVVEYVVDADGADWFKVRWMGYGPEEDTWQQIDTFSAPPGTYLWDCPMPAKFLVQSKAPMLKQETTGAGVGAAGQDAQEGEKDVAGERRAVKGAGSKRRRQGAHGDEGAGAKRRRKGAGADEGKGEEEGVAEEERAVKGAGSKRRRARAGGAEEERVEEGAECEEEAVAVAKEAAGKVGPRGRRQSRTRVARGGGVGMGDVAQGVGEEGEVVAQAREAGVTMAVVRRRPRTQTGRSGGVAGAAAGEAAAQEAAQEAAQRGGGGQEAGGHEEGQGAAAEGRGSGGESAGGAVARGAGSGIGVCEPGGAGVGNVPEAGGAGTSGRRELPGRGAEAGQREGEGGDAGNTAEVQGAGQVQGVGRAGEAQGAGKAPGAGKVQRVRSARQASRGVQAAVAAVLGTRSQAAAGRENVVASSIGAE